MVHEKKPPQLEEIQSFFRKSVIEGDAAANWIRHAHRMDVYSVGYVARLTEALADIYEAVARVLGPRAFESLVVRYLRRHPSKHYNLNFLGRDLPAFLRTDPLTEDLPFLPDLALLEDGIAKSFHSLQVDPLDPKRLAELTESEWSRIAFRFQDGVHVLESAWPVDEIWNSRRKPDSEFSVQLTDSPCRLLVFRDGETVHLERLTQGEFQVLRSLIGGNSLERALSSAGNEINQEDVQDWFAKWIHLNLITNVQ